MIVLFQLKRLGELPLGLRLPANTTVLLSTVVRELLQSLRFYNNKHADISKAAVLPCVVLTVAIAANHTHPLFAVPIRPGHAMTTTDVIIVHVLRGHMTLILLANLTILATLTLATGLTAGTTELSSEDFVPFFQMLFLLR